MERFNLNTWLEDKSREIVTRDGKPARIICYDVKQGRDDCYVPIIALIDKGEEIGEVSYYYSEDGIFLRNSNLTHNLDLFFAEKEESMNEFETRIYNIILSDPHNYPSIKEVKEEAEILLDLARKELEKSNPYSENQKQEWSEEDEKKRNGLVKGLEDRMGFGWANQPFTREEYIEWLKSLKDKVQPQPKQEWSEEDKSMYIRTLGILGKCYLGELPTEVEEELKWLKSFEPNYWKPTNEQIRMITRICNNLHMKNSKDAKGMDELLSQLERLYWNTTKVEKNKTWKPSDEQLTDLYYAAKQLSETRPNLQILYNDIKQL